VPEIVSLTAFGSLALTAFLVYALKGRLSFAMLCVIGIGVAPLVIFLMIFAAFYLGGALPISTVPFWYGFRIMALFVAPNYLLSFVIAGAFLIAWGIRKSIEEGAGVVFVILVPVHGLGLYFSFWFLTQPGSL
jgi:hypothetical protein